jgi:hypothetical protein
MTREEAIAKLKALQESVDFEVAHREADDILVALLNSLGYADVTIEWDAIGKWYA